MAMGAGAATAPMPAPDDQDEVIETPRAAAAPTPARASQSAQAEALSALSNLGYAPGEAASAVAQAADTAPEAETPALIRAALKLLAPQG